MIKILIKVTGGFTGLHGDSKTTEFISLNGSSRYGPNLPRWRDDHCMVTLQNGSILLLGSDVGGYQKHYNSTVFFDPVSKSFTPGQEMNYFRYSSGCAHFQSSYHGNRPIVIVVGGRTTSSFNPGNKTEILDYTVVSL